MDWIKKYIFRKEIPENENPNNKVDIVEKILNFNKQQKGKGLPSDLACIANVPDSKVSNRKHIKIFNSKQMLQKLPIRHLYK